MPKLIQIKPITWQQALPIRQRVLWPSQEPEFSQVDGDETASHYGAFVGRDLVCVASIFQDGKSARLRKFCTVQDYQGQGIGTQVIEHAISQMKSKGVEYFWCDARTSALGFYQRFGLAVEGDEFVKSGVRYYKMSVLWS